MYDMYAVSATVDGVVLEHIIQASSREDAIEQFLNILDEGEDWANIHSGFVEVLH